MKISRESTTINKKGFNTTVLNSNWKEFSVLK